MPILITNFKNSDRTSVSRPCQSKCTDFLRGCFSVVNRHLAQSQRVADDTYRRQRLFHRRVEIRHGRKRKLSRLDILNHGSSQRALAGELLHHHSFINSGAAPSPACKACRNRFGASAPMLYPHAAPLPRTTNVTMYRLRFFNHAQALAKKAQPARSAMSVANRSCNQFGVCWPIKSVLVNAVASRPRRQYRHRQGRPINAG